MIRMVIMAIMMVQSDRRIPAQPCAWRRASGQRGCPCQPVSLGKVSPLHIIIDNIIVIIGMINIATRMFHHYHQYVGVIIILISSRHQAVYTHLLNSVTYLNSESRASIVALDR